MHSVTFAASRIASVRIRVAIADALPFVVAIQTVGILVAIQTGVNPDR